MHNQHPPMPFVIGKNYSCSSGSDQRTLADACHGLHLLVALATVQKFYGMLYLSCGVLLRSALTEVRILPGNCFAGLGALHNHTSLILCKGQHDRENQIAGEGILHKPHVQDVYPNPPVKKLSDG